MKYISIHPSISIFIYRIYTCIHTHIYKYIKIDFCASRPVGSKCIDARLYFYFLSHMNSCEDTARIFCLTRTEFSVFFICFYLNADSGKQVPTRLETVLLIWLFFHSLYVSLFCIWIDDMQILLEFCA